MGFAADIVQMNMGQWIQGRTLPAVDLTGQTVLITGANTGLGLEAAKHLYVSITISSRLSDKVNCSFQLGVSKSILACRTASKGAAAREQILASTPASATSAQRKIEIWSLDLSSYKSVIAFGERLNTLSRLDIFIANAAIDTDRFELLEGHESSITVNVISTFLSAFLSIPILRRTARTLRKPSRLVITGTVGHIFAEHSDLTSCESREIFNTLDDPSKARMADRYHLSKLIALLATRRLAAELDRACTVSLGKPREVILNYPNPGWCKTDLFSTLDAGVVLPWMLWLIGRTPEEGSRTLVHASVGVGGESHGRYLDACRIKPEGSWARSEEASRAEGEMWKELVGILEAIQPGVTVL